MTLRASARVSVIICTYGRSTALEDLLRCLEVQTFRNFEVLIIDGNGEISPARETVGKFLSRPNATLEVTLLGSPKGLTRQRNVGLVAATGSLICFLDDDVTFDEDFLAKAADLFGRPEMKNVGGITAYDSLNYAAPITWRWRLRNLLGTIPSLDPGQVDHLGRAVPLSFLKPWQGQKEIGWLGGFCMIYRREATEGLRFDELLPTYAGEDRDFSMRVGKNWRLLICGDLSIEHHYSAHGRDIDLERLRQSSYGVGRRFAQSARSFVDYLTVARTFLGDLAIDAIAIARRPNRDNLMTLIVRARAFFTGLRFNRNETQPPPAPYLRPSPPGHSDSISQTR